MSFIINISNPFLSQLDYFEDRGFFCFVLFCFVLLNYLFDFLILFNDYLFIYFSLLFAFIIKIQLLIDFFLCLMKFYNFLFFSFICKIDYKKT